MSVCGEASVIQLLVAALAYLLAVLWLDVYWVRVPGALHDDAGAGTLTKQETGSTLSLPLARPGLGFCCWFGRQAAPGPDPAGPRGP